MRYWDELLREQRGDLEIVVDKSWEDISVRDCFDDGIDPDTGKPIFDLDQMEQDINSGRLDWFMLRARVFVEGLEVGSSIVGGFLYEDAGETLKDGTAEDLIYQAIEEAKPQFYKLSRVFAGLSEQVDNETI
jgi:hypothetical protein